MFQPLAWLPGAGMLPFDANPIDCFFPGLVGACGISVLCNLVRVHLFIQSCSGESERDSDDKPRPSPANGTPAGWLSGGALQFWVLTALLSVVGCRVSSLVVLEFCLRAVTAWMTAGPEVLPGSTHLLLVQCQFSLGCALACTLHFLQEGAPHRSYSLLLAAGLSWLVAGRCRHLRSHVARIYRLHSAQRYCGVCITLLTHRCSLLPGLSRAVFLAFGVATGASIATVQHHFLSEVASLKFWTPLTLCYTLLVFHIQEEQHRRPAAEALLHTVVLRLGSLLVLMLIVGRWADVVHILITFLGEAVCLLPAQDLLRPLRQGEDDLGLSSRTEQYSSPEHMSRRGMSTVSSDCSERDGK